MDYQQMLLTMRLAMNLKKINGFDASEVIGAVFPTKSLESILNDLVEIGQNLPTN